MFKKRSGGGPIHARPINAPAAARHAHPAQAFYRRSTRVVVKRGGTFVEAARVRRVAEPEALAIEVMAELVAQSAEKSSPRSDLFAHGGARPDANQHGLEGVIAEKLAGPAAFADAQGPRRECAHSRRLNVVESGGGSEKIRAGLPHHRALAVLNGGFNGGGPDVEAIIRRQFKLGQLVAAQELGEQARLPGERIGKHRAIFGRKEAWCKRERGVAVRKMRGRISGFILDGLARRHLSWYFSLGASARITG